MASSRNLTFSVTTLGCRANQADSERLRAILLSAGLAEREFGQPVDCAIVNTCTVTREADRKSRQLIRRALKASPSSSTVVATGCAVTKRGGVRELPGSVLRLTPDRGEEILELLDVEACPGREKELLPPARARALLKIQDGCDQFCTFCIVPYVRGRSRSRTIEEIVAQAQAFEEQGFTEVVLTGIHLSIWGEDLEGELTLADAVSAIIDGTERIDVRLASVEPDRFPMALIDLMAIEPRVCPFLHLVLQHGSDRILERMHRGYTTSDYRRIVQAFFEKVPQAALSSDIMVGFPGESEEDFQQLCDVVTELPFFHLHVFPYSLRPGTSASKFPDQIEPEVKKHRRDRLLRLGEQKKLDALKSFYGVETTAVLEAAADREGWLKGTTRSGMTVVCRGSERLLGRSVPVLVRRRIREQLVAEVL